MKITIIGTGYVGLVTGACLAELGNDVFCLDVDQRKVDILNNGGIPIHEPGLEEVVARNRAAGRLHFSTDVAASVAHGDIQFIAVGTPPDEDGSADLQYVLAAARNIGRHMEGFKVVVDKSTVPVGTADRVTAAIREELAGRGKTELSFSVVSNPEFLKEGAAVEDFMRPDRIVIGHDQTAEGLPWRQRHCHEGGGLRDQAQGVEVPVTDHQQLLEHAAHLGGDQHFLHRLAARRMGAAVDLELAGWLGIAFIEHAFPHGASDGIPQLRFGTQARQFAPVKGKQAQHANGQRIASGKPKTAVEHRQFIRTENFHVSPPGSWNR